MKVYQAIQFLKLTTYIKIDGKDFEVEFTGGVKSPRRENGKYSTIDPKVQQALEDSPAYGIKWRLVYDSGEPEAPSFVEEKEEVDLKIVDEVTTAQEAKDYLKNEYELGWKEVPKNTTEIKDFAKQHRITFPKW